MSTLGGISIGPRKVDGAERNVFEILVLERGMYLYMQAEQNVKKDGTVEGTALNHLSNFYIIRVPSNDIRSTRHGRSFFTL